MNCYLQILLQSYKEFRGILVSLHLICPKIVKFYLRLLISIAISAIFVACSPTRFVPEGETMLSSVKINSDNPQISAGDYRIYVRQEANSKWLNTLKVPLGIFCMSGTDTTKRFNRFVHRIGEAPVIYDEKLATYSKNAMEAAMRSQGYLQARVVTDTVVKKRRAKLQYNMQSGRRYYVKHVTYDYDNDTIRQEVERGMKYNLRDGMPLDMVQLDEERTRIIKFLRTRGYFNLTPEYISFDADTIQHELGIMLTLKFRAPANISREMAYQQYRLGEVRVHEEPSPRDDDAMEDRDTTLYNRLLLIQPRKSHLRNRVYRREIFIHQDSLYNEQATKLTYQGLNALPIVNYATVRYVTPHEGDSLLNVDVNVNLNQLNSASFDLEGTNTAGDLGGAASLTYTNRNLFRGAEQFSVKLRGAYEAIHHLEGYQSQNYLEYSAEGTLRLPTMPLVFSDERHARLKGNSEISLLYNSQDRPEFHRRLLTGTWSVNWVKRSLPNFRNRLDILSLNYVFMPWISETFTKDYLEGDDPRYAVLRYSYENLFIMKTGYSFVYNSLNLQSATSLNKTNGYQVKFNVETAGNVLYGISKMAHLKQREDGQYELFNIPYSQYGKIDFDFSKSVLIDERNSMAFHAAFGLAIPYGNSTIVLYEKRYFAGGANSVRGWSVRQLGPGSYRGQDGNIDFINQTGNLKLDFSAEYRSCLFWKIEGAAFIDAGNIWNTRNYADQPGGQFRWDTFYKQIAVAYGLGIRFNFNFFILRFDAGMKAIDPVVLSGRDHWPIIHPNLRRDFAFHFAVGLPF